MAQHKSIVHNDVHGDSNGVASSGRDCHVRQVAPDRHQATAHRIATWNVRSLFQAGKLDNIKSEMRRMRVNIMGMCEIRWKGAGILSTGGHKFIYSGGDTHMHGVGILVDTETAKTIKGYWAISDRILLVKFNNKPFDLCIIQIYAPTADSTDEEIERFYEHLDMAKEQCKSQDIVIVQGDFNGKVGNKRHENVTGSHGLGEINERGEKLIVWANTNDMMVTNTWFEQHPRRKWTWISPDGNYRNQIDYILINNRFRNAVKSSKAYPGADCNSDHNPVIANIKLKLKKTKATPMNMKLQLALLKNHQSMREKYQVAVRNKFEILDTIQDIDEKWEHFKEAMTKSVSENVPRMQIKAKQNWMTDEILEKMEERRLNKNNKVIYAELNKEIRMKCNEAKNKWLEMKCDEVEKDFYLNPNAMYKGVKEISRKKTCSSSGCIKSRDGHIIMEKDRILERWAEYISELYNDNRPELNNTYLNLEGAPILKEEVAHAMRKMKSGKAAGPDTITVEMLEPLEDLGLTTLTKLLNDIYESGHIPSDLSKSIFIALPKKPAATECELHRTISLMSHITKILLRILMKRARNKIKPEIAAEQCGFVEGKGTTNAIFILRNIIERSLEMRKDVFICFIDYTKAFDRVVHSKIMDILMEIDLDGKDLRLIRKLYWEQTAAVRIGGEISDFQPIKRGVRQGCVLSPDLFSLYSEQVMRKIKDMPGIKVNGHMLNNIRYADDTTLIAENEQDLQAMLNIVVKESEKMGLSLNKKKTETMVVSRKQTSPTCAIEVNGTILRQVSQFKYLGTIITENGRSVQEVKSRIGQAKTAFHNMKNIFKNKSIVESLKMRLLQCYIEPILTYSCETWTMNTEIIKRLEAAEMWFLRRMLRIPWTERKTNKEVLKEAGCKRSLINKIRSRQAKFFGHAMRGGGLEKLSVTGKITGKRAPGRQRQKMMDSLTSWLGTGRNSGTIRATETREEWRAMTANATKLGT